ncbi:uncharacterized protein GBIM_05510 [Gryllus bimaculatus]|nr:uncharacterized protein GBIM_05510 [Gryllus bimaculatus]
MGTFAFYEILGSVLRQSRFRLVHEIYQSTRKSFFCKIYKNNFKNQVLGVKFPVAPLWYHDVVFCTCQSNNTVTMPKHKFEDSSDSKHKDKKVHKKRHLKSSSLKSIKKKKKKKASHHHKKSKVKERSSKPKTLISKKTEVILLDTSPENKSNDSDICIIYESHKRGRSFEPCHNILVKKNKYASEHCNSNINESPLNICGENTQNDDSKETNENFILHEVPEQCTSVKETCENVLITEEEKNIISADTSVPSGDGVSTILKSDQAVSGPSSGKRANKYRRKSKTNIKRNWKWTDFGQMMSDKTKGTSTNERDYLLFNVLSYNVLCQEIMEEHMDLYQHHNPNCLNWEFRSKLLMKEFVDFDADVICLQEVQESHLKSFYRYTGLFKQRTGGKKDGVAIYFRNSTFQLVDYTTVEYYQPGVSVLNRDNVGLIVKLAPNVKPDERVVVATTHLLYNPKRHDVKLAQIQLLLAEVERYAFKEIDESTKNTKYWPVILTGDMNFEPNSGGFQLLNMGWFRYDGLCSRTLTTEYYGLGRILGKELIPPFLGVTDYCQHISLVTQRDLQFAPEYERKFKDDHKTERKLLQIYNSDFTKHTSSSGNIEITESKELNQVYVTSPKKFSTGQLRHALHLSSVYSHDPQDYFHRSQVSTFQDRWVVVDYIFYSNKWNPDTSSKEEGNLKLVARYKLLSADEAEDVGPIPNDSSPSDHYPLAAKFALLF